MLYSEAESLQLIACLRRLGFSDKHHFIQALQTTRSVDLNAFDDFNLTPLRLAIQKQDIEAIKTLNSYIPEHKYLSNYDTAILEEIILNKKSEFNSFDFPTHHELIYCVQALYSIDPNHVEQGMCFGIAHMRRQAFFSREINVYNRRLKNIKANLWPIIQKTMAEVTDSGIDRKTDIKKYVEAVRQKLRNKFPYCVWQDIYKFFDGVILYLNPHQFSHIFEQKKTLTQNQLPAERMLRPVKMENIHVATPHIFSGRYTKNTLPKYFKCLEQAFKQFNLNVSLEINTGGHTYTIEYCYGKWIYNDSNHLEDSQKECSSWEISELLLTHYTDPLIFSTRAFVSPDKLSNYKAVLNRLNKNLDWAKIHNNITAKNVTKKNSHGYSLLYVAAACGDQATVKKCIATNKKSILNAPINDGYTPLMIASQEGHTEVVKELLAEIKDENEINKTLSDGSTAIYIASQNGYHEIIKEFIGAFKNKNKMQVPRNGFTPFLIAAMNGHHNVVKEWIKTDKNLIKQTNSEESTALYLAASYGHYKVVKEILSIFPEEKFISLKIKNVTSLFVAAEYGHTKCVAEILNALKDKTTNNEVIQDILTVFYEAAQNNRLDVIKEFHNIFKDPVFLYQANKDGITPLYNAASNGHFRMVQEFVKVLNDDDAINVTYKHFTPLMAAVDKGHIECVTAIIDGLKNKKLIYLTAADGATALYIAAQNGFLDIVKVIIQALTDETLIQLPRNDGYTALFIAAENGHAEIVKEFMKITKDKQVKGKTAFYLAVEKGHINCVEVFINAQKNENAIHEPSSGGETPLFAAVRNGHLNIVKKFFDEFGNKLMHQKCMEKTLLEVAIEEAHRDIVAEFFKRNLITMSEIYNSNKNLLDLAKNLKQPDIYNSLFNVQQAHRKKILTQILHKYRNHNFNLNLSNKSVTLKDKSAKDVTYRLPKKDRKIYNDLTEILKHEITDSIYHNILIKINTMLNVKKLNSHRFFGKHSNNDIFDKNLVQFIAKDLAVMNNLPKSLTPTP